MATLRLYHRRPSASREKSIYSLSASPTNQRVRKLGAQNPRGSIGSLGLPMNTRPRSLSLFPGSQGLDSLQVPGRSRSMSFSGENGLRSTTITMVQPVLTSSEEDHIFRCYVRVMYMMLGILGAAVLGLIFYSLSSTVVFNTHKSI